MDTQHGPAMRARPACFFPVQERFHPKRPEILKVIQHTHPIAGTVTFIEAF